MAHNHQVTGSNPVVRNQICSLEFEHATDLTVNQRLAEIVTQTWSQNLVPWRSGSATLLQREGHWFNPNRNYQVITECLDSLGMGTFTYAVSTKSLRWSRNHQEFTGATACGSQCPLEGCSPCSTQGTLTQIWIASINGDPPGRLTSQGLGLIANQ